MLTAEEQAAARKDALLRWLVRELEMRAEEQTGLRWLAEEARSRLESVRNAEGKR